MKLTFDTTESESIIWQELGGASLQVLVKSTLYRGVKIYCRYQMYQILGAEWKERSTEFSVDLKTWFGNTIELQRHTKKLGL
jgi:hypothetical protein